MRDRGESLVEIVLAVVVIGIAVSALVAGLATAANAAGAHRASVVADTTLRNAAEDVKLAARACSAGAPLAVDLGADDGWTVRVSPSTPTCPPPTETSTLTFTTTGPTGQEWSLDVVVRSP